MSLIEIEDVHKVYKTGDVEVHALRGVSLSIERAGLHDAFVHIAGEAAALALGEETPAEAAR